MHVGTLLHKSGQFLLDFLLPPNCINCKTTGSWLCQNCLNQISFIDPPVCNRCGISIVVGHVPLCRECMIDNSWQYIDGVRATSNFNNSPMRPIIHLLKYRNHQAVAEILGRLLADTYRRHNLVVDIIVPVPLHTSRLRERGYNQSELLAKKVGEFLDITVNTDILQRTRKTKSQVDLKAEERRQNVINAFACRNQRLLGQKVLLIDDVCTTGSTLDACAAALKKSGVTSVWGLTLAKAY